MFTVVHRIWTHASQPGDVNYQGTMRWLVLTDGLCYDHFGTETEARDCADRMNAEED